MIGVYILIFTYIIIMEYDSIKLIQNVLKHMPNRLSKNKNNNSCKSQFINTLFYIIKHANKLVDKIFPLMSDPIVEPVNKNSNYLREMNPPIENVISKEIVNHIHEKIHYVIIYRFSFLDVQDFTIYFYVYEKPTKRVLSEYNQRVYIIMNVISFVLLSLQTKKLNNQRLFFFMTNYKKEIPSYKVLLEQYHVNTGYTAPHSGCSDIIIYRKEEWFKVFIHEYIHNHHLDCDEMNNEFLKLSKKIYCINNEILFSETISELWALLLNILIISYLFKEKNMFQELRVILPPDIMKGKSIDIFWYLLIIEVYFSLLQTNKILQYLGIRYSDLLNESCGGSVQSKKMYKIHHSNTNICSYYIIKSIYLYFYLFLFTNLEKILYNKPVNIKYFESMSKHPHIIRLLDEPIPFHINSSTLKMCALEIH